MFLGPDFPTQKIDYEAGKYELLVRSLAVHALAPEVGPNTTHYLQWANRLGNVIIGPHFEAHDDASFTTAGREHDYWYVATFPEFLAEGDSIDTREHYVQHDEIKGTGRAKAL